MSRKLFTYLMLAALFAISGCAKAISFDKPSESWSKAVIVASQNPKAVELLFDDGQMKFRLNGQESYVYSILDSTAKKNVAIEVTMSNNGSQTNNAAILCRVNSDRTAWYEFHVASSGRFGLVRFDQELKDAGENPWVTLVKTSTSDVISNVKPNVIKVVCDGTRLALTVNDTQLFEKENGELSEAGSIGLGAIAYDALPVVIGFDDVKVSVP